MTHNKAFHIDRISVLTCMIAGFVFLNPLALAHEVFYIPVQAKWSTDTLELETGECFEEQLDIIAEQAFVYSRLELFVDPIITELTVEGVEFDTKGDFTKGEIKTVFIAGCVKSIDPSLVAVNLILDETSDHVYGDSYTLAINEDTSPRVPQGTGYNSTGDEVIIFGGQ